MPLDKELFGMLPNERPARKQERLSTQFNCECGRVIIVTKTGRTTTCKCGLVWTANSSLSMAHTKIERTTVMRIALP